VPKRSDGIVGVVARLRSRLAALGLALAWGALAAAEDVAADPSS
jgi:hypothetical protein